MTVEVHGVRRFVVKHDEREFVRNIFELKKKKNINGALGGQQLERAVTIRRRRPIYPCLSLRFSCKIELGFVVILCTYTRMHRRDVRLSKNKTSTRVLGRMCRRMPRYFLIHDETTRAEASTVLTDRQATICNSSSTTRRTIQSRILNFPNRYDARVDRNAK